MDEKIKSCPFCGGDADIWGMTTRYGYVMVKVQCDVCGAQSKALRYGGDKKLGDDGFFDDITCEKVISAWNMRQKGE